MNAEIRPGHDGVNIDGVVYERGLVTSKKWVAGVNAGGILLSEFSQMPITLFESLANSKLGQVVKDKFQAKKAR